jgi:hypothetical protein
VQSIGSNAIRNGGRKRIGLAIAGASFLLVGAGSAGLAALAESIDSNIASSCSIGSSKMAVSVPLTVDDKVDPITAGGHETLVTKTGFPTLPVEVTINKLVVTEPIPDQIATTDSVTFAGGNVAGSYAISGQNLVLTFTGPVSSKDMQVPVVTANQTVKDGIAPTTIDWKTFSQIVADTNYGQATCVPNDPTQNVNTTKVVAGGSTATTSPTTSPTPTTTAPTPTTTTPAAGASSPGLPVPAPGLPVPTPGLPVPTPGVPALPTPPAGVPSLPAPPALSGPPAVPGVPTGPCPALPVPVPVPIPASPVPCPTIPGSGQPPIPALPGIGVTASASVDLGL